MKIYLHPIPLKFVYTPTPLKFVYVPPPHVLAGKTMGGGINKRGETMSFATKLILR